MYKKFLLKLLAFSMLVVLFLPSYVVRAEPQFQNKDFQATIGNQIQRFTVSLKKYTALNREKSANIKISYTYSIVVNRTTRKLDLYKNGMKYITYNVSVGKNKNYTPKGTFKIINKQLNPGGPYGSRWMGISSPNIGIHGTNDPSSIGKYASLGCIRMYNKDVIQLYNIVSVGTIVKIID